ncbi:hypothetical protein BTM25_05580 [Actinomadura rubteroloni]|uniref:Uncharacterized protein n=1 Tax=Actinomadura rubteroloni TaxID=1926885 RepID=A0A2P4UME1_9ACTN|nr:hypothetical protein [Actinomadura rubteroloni]POM26169.1 hypothetical protein BTM25_05580 [Actinomadura rubteroloni]
MYNTPPVGGVAAGFGGAAAASPWLGVQALWVGLAVFTFVSAGLAVKRILPARRG